MTYTERGYGHVGNLHGGFFFTDFGDKVKTISLKSVDTVRNEKWKGQIINDIRKLHEQGDHLLGIDDRVAKKTLHMVVPGGERNRLRGELREVSSFAKDLNIKISVSEY